MKWRLASIVLAGIGLVGCGEAEKKGGSATRRAPSAPAPNPAASLPGNPPMPGGGPGGPAGGPGLPAGGPGATTTPGTSGVASVAEAAFPPVQPKPVAIESGAVAL